MVKRRFVPAGGGGEDYDWTNDHVYVKAPFEVSDGRVTLVEDTLSQGSSWLATITARCSRSPSSSPTPPPWTSSVRSTTFGPGSNPVVMVAGPAPVAMQMREIAEGPRKGPMRSRAVDGQSPGRVGLADTCA